MSAEHGKTEIIGLTETSDEESDPPKTNTAWSPLKRGIIVFRCHRSPSNSDLQGGLIMAVRNPDALWLSGYEDRILYDCRPGGVNKLGVLADQWLAGVMAAAAKEEERPSEEQIIGDQPDTTTGLVA